MKNFSPDTTPTKRDTQSDRQAITQPDQCGCAEEVVSDML